MDSLSQLALGAAVAQAGLGHKIGRRALIVGAALGTLPDLDVVVRHADAIDAFTRHRGFSHSLFVLSLLSLPLSALCKRLLDSESAASGGRWLFVVWAVLITHSLLDGFTVYGTQWFWPLPVPPVAIGSIFIIDPLYTLPLLIGIVLAWCWQDRRGRRANATGLVLAQAWLLASLVLQQVARHEAVAALHQQGVDPSAVRVMPLPLGVMWRSLALDGEDVLEGWFSLVDGDDSIRFDRVPRDLERLGDLQTYAPVQRMDWFTGGFMAARETGNTIVLSDLRMGSINNPVFAFDIATRVDQRLEPIQSRDRLIYFCPPEIFLLARRMLDASVHIPQAQLPGTRLPTLSAAQVEREASTIATPTHRCQAETQTP